MTLRDSARLLAETLSPERELARVAIFALDPDVPAAGESEQILRVALSILADPDADEDRKDACALAVARAARKLLPDGQAPPDEVNALASAVLKEEGWSAHAMRLAGSTLSSEPPDRGTAHDIASVAAMVMTSRDSTGVADFSDVDTPEVGVLAGAALRRLGEA